LRSRQSLRGSDSDDRGGRPLASPEFSVELRRRHRRPGSPFRPVVRRQIRRELGFIPAEPGIVRTGEVVGFDPAIDRVRNVPPVYEVRDRDVDVAVGDADPVDRLIAEFEQNFSARELPSHRHTTGRTVPSGSSSKSRRMNSASIGNDSPCSACRSVAPGPRLTWRFLEERDGAVDCGVLVGERL